MEPVGNQTIRVGGWPRHVGSARGQILEFLRGNQIIGAARCLGVVDISMWASDRCLGIFQSHAAFWNISAWESGGFLGFWSWWVAQICRTARNQIIGLLRGSDIGGSPMPGLVDERPYWSLSETRKSELVGGPDMSEVQGDRSLSL